MLVSENVVIRYLQPNEVIFIQKDSPKKYFYVVHDGAIHLTRSIDNDEHLVDVCDEGDLFGVRPLMVNDHYLLSARANEETLLFAINFESIKSLIQKYPSVAWYFAQNFAAGIQNKFVESQKHSFRNRLINEIPDYLVEVQSVKPMRNPVTCAADETVQNAAILMSENNVGSIIIVNASQHPIGILTDRDLRNKVVTGKFALSTQVSEIMTTPVITMQPGVTISDFQVEMMKYGIHHLCITENGNSNSRIIGVISQHDILVAQGNNPAILIREVSRSNNPAALKRIREKAEKMLYQYLVQDVSMKFISKVMTEINDSIISRAIELAQEELHNAGQKKPDVKWCWMALGSEGREEQLLRTDQDSALVFENVPVQQGEYVQQYFLSLAQKTTIILKYCGFEDCPANMMASNPQWCMSVEQWENQFSQWIREPTEKNVMLCTIFFDFRPIVGDRSLTERLTKHIIETIESKSIFLNFLAKDAVENPPPLTFFRQFMVEKSGAHKDAFDIKARAMMPLTDAARILILNAKMPGINNTLHRFEKLAELEPQNKELYEEAASAYKILMRYRALQGIKNQDDGRYFIPAKLSKVERLDLRNSFRPISDLHELLKVRFQLSILL
jgi:CBS domain-containing protein